MSKNQLTTTQAPAVPDHIRARFGDLGAVNSELSGGITGGFPVISFKGKTWALVENGERTLLVNGDGDPRPAIEVVIVKASPTISKTYYASGYEEGSSDQPDCHSNDGVGPAPDAANPQAKKCATCPRNIWGSKITESGKKGRECADVKRLAVADPDDLDKLCLLRVPAASLKFLSQFADTLSKRGAPYQAVVTRIGFDPSVAHPQFTFKAPRWLTEEQLDKVEELQRGDLVSRILGIDAAGRQVAEAEEDEDDVLPPGPPPTRVQQPAAKATAAQPQTAKATTKAPAKAKAAEAVIPSEEELESVIAGDEKVVDLAAAKASKPSQARPSQSVDAVLAEAEEELTEILSGLDDDDD